MVSAHSEAVSGCAFSPDGSRLVTSSRDKEARIWDAETGELIHVLPVHCGPLYGCAWSADGMFVATAGDEPALGLFDAASGDCLDELWPGGITMFSCAFSPDTCTLYAADDYDRLWAFGIHERQFLGRILGSSYSSRFLALSHDGSILAMGNRERGLRLQDAFSGEVVGDFNQLAGQTCCCAFFPSDDRLLMGTEEGELGILQVDPPGLLESWDDGGGDITACAVSPDGGLLAYARKGKRPSPLDEDTGWNAVLSLRDGSSAEPLVDLAFAEEIRCASFYPSGKGLALGDSAGILHMVDLEAQRAP
jgi:WD40 repeat protein